MPTNPYDTKLYVVQAEQHTARGTSTNHTCVYTLQPQHWTGPLKGTSECCLFTVQFLTHPNQFGMLYFIPPKWLEWQAIESSFQREKKKAWERVAIETKDNRWTNYPSPIQEVVKDK